MHHSIFPQPIHNDMKKAILYCDPRSLNDATNYYVGIIRRTLEQSGYEWSVVHKLSQIKEVDLILTITERYFLLSKLRFSKVKTIYWAQGVSAEEAKIYINSVTSRLRYYFRRFAEPIAIKKSDILFCVSDRMVEYYNDAYGHFDRAKVIVMPCYNLPLSCCSDTKRYKTPSFVYAGNDSSWQCIDTMLEVYSYIESRMPNARLTIFTANKETFLPKIKELGIKSFDIKYVPVSELQEEIKKFKYGFVLRDNHIINQVATPTKMNSYLASLLIPIFSDGVDDFKRNINLNEFTLMAKCPLNVEEIGKMIIEFESMDHQYDKYPKTVQDVFRNHFDDNKYICQLKQKLNNG